MSSCASAEEQAVGKARQQCAHCGTCTTVCPVYRVTGRESLTARGKLHLLETGLANRPSAVFTDIFARCLLCGACESTCPRDLPVKQRIVEARQRFGPLYGRHSVRRNLARITLARPGLLEGLVRAGIGLERLSPLPADSGLRIRLGLLEGAKGKRGTGREGKSREEHAGGTRLSYFSGCLARHLQPSVGSATRRLVRELAGTGLHEPERQACCGMASWSAGNLEEARRLAKNNIAAFENRPGPVLTSCASCTAHLARYPALFEDDPVWQGKAEAFSDRVRDFSAFLLENGGRKVLPAPALRRVFYHEPCHLRFGGEDRDAPRDIMRQVADITLVESDVHHCCGQGGLFHLGYPELSARIFARAEDAARTAEPDAVVTGCSGCLLQWQAGMAIRPGRVPVMHLAVFLARCLEAAAPKPG